METENGKHTVFFSWNSHNSENSKLKKFVEDAVRKAGLDYDESTRNVSGSPPIVTTILEKIEKTTVFVADLTEVKLLDKKDGGKEIIPNSNVMLELGYAIAKIGYSRIITITTTEKDKLPFDVSWCRYSRIHLNKTGKHRDLHVKDVSGWIKKCFKHYEESIGITDDNVPENDHLVKEILDRYYAQPFPDPYFNQIACKTKTFEERRKCLSEIRRLAMHKLKYKEAQAEGIAEMEDVVESYKRNLRTRTEPIMGTSVMASITYEIRMIFGAEFNEYNLEWKTFAELKSCLARHLGEKPENELTSKAFDILFKIIKLFDT